MKPSAHLFTAVAAASLLGCLPAVACESLASYSGATDPGYNKQGGFVQSLDTEMVRGSPSQLTEDGLAYQTIVSLDLCKGKSEYFFVADCETGQYLILSRKDETSGGSLKFDTLPPPFGEVEFGKPGLRTLLMQIAELSTLSKITAHATAKGVTVADQADPDHAVFRHLDPERICAPHTPSKTEKSK